MDVMVAVVSLRYWGVFIRWNEVKHFCGYCWCDDIVTLWLSGIDVCSLCMHVSLVGGRYVAIVVITL